MKRFLYSYSGNSLQKGIIPSLFFFLFFSLSISLKAQVYSANFNSNIQSWVNGSSNSWSRVSTGGVSNSGCIRSTIVCEEGQQQGSCINQNNYFIATPAISLVGGNTYQISIKCSVSTASTRKLVLGVNTTQARSTATTIQNFGYVSTGGYTTFTVNYSPTSTGSPYFVLWGEKFITQSVNLWLDDFTVTLVNSAPSVSLTKPVNNSVYVEGDSPFLFQASATDAENNLSKVEFFSNGTKVGERTSLPLSITYIPTVGGTYSLTAKATDSYGAYTTSAARSISFRTRPSISFVTPDLEYPSYAEGPLNLEVNASDADGTVSSVKFYIDDNLVYTDATSPWIYNWAATPGSHTFLAVATDNHGLESPANLAPIGFDVVPNTCSLSAPTSSIICEGDSATMTSGYSSLLNGTIQWQQQLNVGSWTKILDEYNSTYTISEAGNYRVIWSFSNSATCTTETQSFAVRSKPSLTVDPVSVYGTEPALAVANASGGTAPYTYSWNNLDSCLSPSCDSTLLLNFDSAAFVTVRDLNQCTSSTSIILNRIDRELLPSDTLVCPSTGYRVDVNTNYLNGFNYIWNDGSTGSYLIIHNPGLYWVRTTSNDGILFSDSILVSFDCSLCEPDPENFVSFVQDTSYFDTVRNKYIAKLSIYSTFAHGDLEWIYSSNGQSISAIHNVLEFDKPGYHELTLRKKENIQCFQFKCTKNVFINSTENLTYEDMTIVRNGISMGTRCLIKLMPNTFSEETNTELYPNNITSSNIDFLSNLIEFSKVNKIDYSKIKFEKLGINVIDQSDNLKDIYQVLFPDYVDIYSFMSRLKNCSSVLYVQPPVIIKELGVGYGSNPGAPTMAGSEYSSRNLYNFWHLDRIQANEAWAFYRPEPYFPKPIVGIFDGGLVNKDHEDLIGAVKNTNFYVDGNLPGCTHDDELFAKYQIEGHATMVGGAIAANNNSVGNIGVASPGPNLSFVDLHSFAFDCGLRDPRFPSNIDRKASRFNMSFYSENNQILKSLEANSNLAPRILNCSFAIINDFSRPDHFELFPFWADFIKNLQDKGVLIVAGAGNSFEQTGKGVVFPAGFEGVVGVGASSIISNASLPGSTMEHGMGSGRTPTESYLLSDLMTSGRGWNYNVNLANNNYDNAGFLDITAPGGIGIQSSYYNYSYPAVNNTYDFGGGTSYSSPMVAGVLGSMAYINPNPLTFTNSKMIEILFGTADKVNYNPEGLKDTELDEFVSYEKGYRYKNNTLTNPDLDLIMGHGRVNMLSCIMNAAALRPGGYVFDQSNLGRNVTVRNVNNQEYLYSSRNLAKLPDFHEEYEYDAVLNQEDAELEFKGAASGEQIEFALENGSTFRISNGAHLSFSDGAKLSFLPQGSGQMRKRTHLNVTGQSTIIEFNSTSVTLGQYDLISLRDGATLILNNSNITVAQDGLLSLADGSEIILNGNSSLTLNGQSNLCIQAGCTLNINNVLASVILQNQAIMGIPAFMNYHPIASTKCKCSLTASDNEIIGHPEKLSNNAGPNVPTVSAGADITTNIGSYTLNLPQPSPAGGSWHYVSTQLGTSLNENGQFIPSATGPGSVVLQYLLCGVSDNLTVTLINQPIVSAGPDLTVCNSANFILDGGLPAGGFWEGQGVTIDGRFNATNLDVGQSYSVSYCYNGQCDYRIISILAPIAQISANNDFASNCPGAKPLTITANIQSGEWHSSSDVTYTSNNNIATVYPSSYNPYPPGWQYGYLRFSYTYPRVSNITDIGCTAEVQEFKVLILNSLFRNIYALSPDNTPVCEGAENISLPSLIQGNSGLATFAIYENDVFKASVNELGITVGTSIVNSQREFVVSAAAIPQGEALKTYKIEVGYAGCGYVNDPSSLYSGSVTVYKPVNQQVEFYSGSTQAFRTNFCEDELNFPYAVSSRIPEDKPISDYFILEKRNSNTLQWEIVPLGNIADRFWDGWTTSNSIVFHPKNAGPGDFRLTYTNNFCSSLPPDNTNFIIIKVNERVHDPKFTGWPVAILNSICPVSDFSTFLPPNVPQPGQWSSTSLNIPSLIGTQNTASVKYTYSENGCTYSSDLIFKLPEIRISGEVSPEPLILNTYSVSLPSGLLPCNYTWNQVGGKVPGDFPENQPISLIWNSNWPTNSPAQKLSAQIQMIDGAQLCEASVVKNVAPNYMFCKQKNDGMIQLPSVLTNPWMGPGRWIGPEGHLDFVTFTGYSNSTPQQIDRIKIGLSNNFDPFEITYLMSGLKSKVRFFDFNLVSPGLITTNDPILYCENNPVSSTLLAPAVLTISGDVPKYLWDVQGISTEVSSSCLTTSTGVKKVRISSDVDRNCYYEPSITIGRKTGNINVEKEVICQDGTNPKFQYSGDGINIIGLSFVRGTNIPVPISGNSVDVNSNVFANDGKYTARFITDDNVNCPFNQVFRILGSTESDPTTSIIDVETYLLGDYQINSGKYVTVNSGVKIYAFGEAEIEEDEVPGGNVIGSKILVKPGASFSMLHDSKIEAVCNTMWKGIEMEVDFAGSTHPTVKMDRAIVKDAYYGVRSVAPTNSNPTENAAPYIDVQGTRFENCYFGMDLFKPFLPSSGSLTSKIIGNTFTSQYDQMKAPFDWASNSVFKVGDDKSSVGDNGLSGRYVSLIGLHFSKPFKFNSTSDFVDNQFFNSAFGVFYQNENETASPSETPFVSGNTFTNCHLASIYANGCYKFNAVNNTINMASTSEDLMTFQMDGPGAFWLDNGHIDAGTIPALHLRSFGIHLGKDGCSQSITRTLENNTIVNSASEIASAVSVGHYGIFNYGLPGNEHVFKKNTVQNMEYGIISSNGAGSSIVNISGNILRDNQYNVLLKNTSNSGIASLDFTLKCNQFKLSCVDGPNATATSCDGEPLRKGLVIGEGVRVFTNSINGPLPDELGGTQAFNPSNPLVAHPNANDWPVKFGTLREFFPLLTPDDDIQQGWSSPPNWRSLENQNLNNIIYRRYKNEFVQNYSLDVPPFTTGLAGINGSGTWVKTVDLANANLSISYEPACTTLIDDPDPIFPARISVISGSQVVTSMNLELSNENAWLGAAVPNPAQYKTSVLAFIPSSEEMAILQFIDLGTGKVLSAKSISERGNIEIDIDLKHFPAGVYGYQVILKDKMLGAKRFIVVK